eukprot:352952-Chlamydomonas_euryale.AAC.4
MDAIVIRSEGKTVSDPFLPLSVLKGSIQGRVCPIRPSLPAFVPPAQRRRPLSRRPPLSLCPACPMPRSTPPFVPPAQCRAPLPHLSYLPIAALHSPICPTCPMPRSTPPFVLPAQCCAPLPHLSYLPNAELHSPICPTCPNQLLPGSPACLCCMRPDRCTRVGRCAPRPLHAPNRCMPPTAERPQPLHAARSLQARLPILHASRPLRPGIRTFALLESPAAAERAAADPGARTALEVYAHLTLSSSNRRSGAGDGATGRDSDVDVDGGWQRRWVAAPFLAHEQYNGRYKWLLMGGCAGMEGALESRALHCPCDVSQGEGDEGERPCT